MCGIAGVFGAFNGKSGKSIFDNLARGLQHRGPDGIGVYSDGQIGLIHTRLSIIDLSANGNQPFYNEDKSVVLVCNGEIYNFQQIKKELEARNHQFSSNSDCEVILHLYEEHPNDFQKVLHRLTGMFAFALWDVKRQSLYIARDRIGIKPLYYGLFGSDVVFASEVKPIAKSGLFEATLDYTSLYEYFLLGSVPGPNTLFNEIKSLEPGHFVHIQKNKFAITQYWDIPAQSKNKITEAGAQEEMESLLSQVIKEHLVADVPVGSFLSAGIDSSLITAIAVEHHPGINSFTASFPGAAEDEGVIANATAKTLKTTHFDFQLKSNFFEDFTPQFKDFDQPFAIRSALALGRISKLARQHVKVVLSGDGGDELFGGYHRHEFPERPGFLKYIPKFLQDDLLKIGAKTTGKKSLETLRESLQVSEANMFLHRISIEEAASAMSILAPEYSEKIDTQRFLRRIDKLFTERADGDKLNRVLYVDMKTTLVDEMLTKCDRMTMMNGIEGRVPFLDHRLVEFAFKIPAAYKRQNGKGKILVRRFLAKKLGQELAFRDKTGFNSPFKQWLTKDKPTYDFVMKSYEESKNIGFLNQAKVESTIQNLESMKAESVFSMVCLNTYLNQMHT